MTCIVGIVDKEKGCVVIGADSASVGGGEILPLANPKVFKVGNFVIGCTTSFRMIQLLRFSFNPPKIGRKDLYRYMCSDFVNEIRAIFNNGGFMTIESNKEKGGHFLVGYKDRLFCVQSDFSVNENLSGYDSLGSGSSYALGSIYSSMDSDNDIEGIVLNSLAASANFSTGVCEPFNILTT